MSDCRCWYTLPAESLESKLKQYDEVLKTLLDKHAPEVSKQVVDREARPWMTYEIANEKRKRRRLERRWRKTKQTVDRETYETQRQVVRNMITIEKKRYYNKQITDCDGDQKKLFNIVDNLLNRKKPTALPQHNDLKSLVETFSDFFVGKIETIRNDLSELESSAGSLSCPPVSSLLPQCNTKMESLPPATQE